MTGIAISTVGLMNYAVTIKPFGKWLENPGPQDYHTPRGAIGTEAWTDR